MLAAGREAARALHERLRADGRFATACPPQLDILVFTPRAARASETPSLARKVFEQAARRHLHLALAELPPDFFDLDGMERDRGTVACLRSVLMKPEHLGWMDRIWGILSEATDAALGRPGTRR
jgi:hypothetical protein